MPLEISLGAVGEDSIAATVYALVERAVSDRPDLAAELAGSSVRLELGYPAVRVDFGRDAVVVGDDGGAPADTVIAGSLPDVSALIAAPLAAGIPNPTKPRGRAALARLADGRIALGGSVGVGRKVLQLLALDA